MLHPSHPRMPATPAPLPPHPCTPAAQYTLILPASKNLPSQCVDFMRSKTLHRKSVGVRMPGHRITQVVYV